MLEAVLYIGITQSIFAGFVIATKRPQWIADRIIASWLFLIGIEMILAMVNVRWLELIPYQLPFLVVPMVYGPLVFLYVKSLLAEKPVFKAIELLHFLPFVLLLGIAFFFRDPKDMQQPEPFSQEYPSWFARSIYNIIVFVSITIYSSLSFVLLTRHRKRLKEHFSYKSGRITLNWLLFVSITVYVSFCLSFLTLGVNLFVQDVLFDPKLFTYIGLTLFSFAFSFYGYRQASIYSLNQPAIPKISDKEGLPGKYAKSLMEEKEMKVVLKKLENCMNTDRLYLRPELDLSEVARHLGIPKHHITQTLSTLTDKNFYTFINEYRVNEFEKRINSNEYQNFTLLAIALDCGFNSKSTFNAVYKKLTGRTPSEFLRKKSN